MQELEIKKGHFKNIDGGKLKQVMTELLGDVKEEAGGKLVGNFGAMKPITLWIKDNKTLCVDINSVQVPDDEALKTIRAKNDLLEKATGFTAKERSKRLQKKAKEGTL